MSPWLWRWGPALLQMGLIFSASSVSDLPRLPADVSDKTMHFGAYAALAAFFLRGTSNMSWRGVDWRSGAAAVAWTAAYGVSDELHQWFVPGRTSSVADWVADVLGATAAVVVLWILARVLVRRGRTV